MAKRKKKVARKTAKRKTARRTTRKASKAASPRAKKPTSAGDRARSKGQIVGNIAENTGLNRKQVGEVFDQMSMMVAMDLGRRGPGTFTIPGLVKLRVHKKPARKARKGVNPFTGEEMMFKARPATNVVKFRALKSLKEMV